MIVNVLDKYSVKLKYANTEFRIVSDFVFDAVSVLNGVCKQYQQNIYITAITEGNHSKNSQHYKGLALDLSVSGLSNIMINVIIDSIILADKDYYAYYEVGGSAPHIHIQYSSDNLKERTKNKINKRRLELQGVNNV